MHQNKTEKIIIDKLNDILSQINNNNLSLENAQWLLSAISYNYTILNNSNENINNILSNIYQAISVKGISITEKTDTDKSLQVLAKYTQFLVKEKNFYDSINSSSIF